MELWVNLLPAVENNPFTLQQSLFQVCIADKIARLTVGPNHSVLFR